MSDQQIKVMAIDGFTEYHKENISCEVMEGEEFIAVLNEESGEYFAVDSKGREVFVAELNAEGKLELDECFELIEDAPFGSYAAHQPGYENLKHLGKLDDYIYQSLVHMQNASHQLSWGLTVLDHADIPADLREEIRLTVVKTSSALSDLQEKLRSLRK